MFAAWVSHGAEIGVTAFCAVFTFGIIVAALYGLFCVFVAAMATEDKGKNRSNTRRYRE